MSFRKLRVINTIAFVAAIIALGVGCASLLNHISSLAVGVGLSGLFVGFGLWGFTRRRGSSGKASATGFCAILRTHHNTAFISREEVDQILRDLIEDPRPSERVVEGSRCRDCGHEEVILQTDKDELFAIVKRMPFTHTRMWFFGLFGLWTRHDPVMPLASLTIAE